MPIAPVTLSEQSNSRAMQLALSDLRYLFEAPAVDPFAGSHVGRSGVEAVLQRLKREKLPRDGTLHLRIAAPADQTGPQALANIQQALTAYTAAQIVSEEDALNLIRRETRQSLRVGGLFLVACLVLAALVDHLSALPPFAQTLLRESLIIAGWVGLWHPLDLLLYSWWPNRFRISLLKYLKAARLELQPA